VLWGVSWFPTWPSCKRQEVTTSVLCGCGSGAARRRALRGPCLCSNPPGKKKQKKPGYGTRQGYPGMCDAVVSVLHSIPECLCSNSRDAVARRYIIFMVIFQFLFPIWSFFPLVYYVMVLVQRPDEYIQPGPVLWNRLAATSSVKGTAIHVRQRGIKTDP
jgi:hypothetical protein